MKNLKWLLIIFAISFVNFFRSLKVFYTNDDFFHLSISRVANFSDFVNFFNIFSGSKTNTSFRPLSTQVFYYIGEKISLTNPLWMHIVLFVLFFAIVYLVYLLVRELITNEKIALLGAFLYSVSATHFGQLYYLATQELWWTFFALLSLVEFIRYLKNGKIGNYLLSLTAFLFGLLSKESAVVIPALIAFSYIYFRFVKEKTINTRTFLKSFLPFVILLFLYLYLHYFKYGLQGGESYIWDFSPRVLNTLFWYTIWSFNIPEMLVDFIGPGLKINIPQLVYWKDYILTAVVSSFVLGILLLARIKSFIKSARIKDYSFIVFGVFLFVFSLIPVLFLPWHKFVYYLTLPLVGICLSISYYVIKSKVKTAYIALFCILWFVSSVSSLSLSEKTNWITQGEKMSKEIYDYIDVNINNSKKKEVVCFYDSESDDDLPWKPSDVIKNTLSDNNFFAVFFPQITAYYGSCYQEDSIRIPARQFLGY